MDTRKPERMTAADLNRHTRSHWGIENRSHYIRDTTFREDDSQAWAAEGPHALASLRNLALGLFRLKNANSIKETTEWICRDRIRALPVHDYVASRRLRLVILEWPWRTCGVPHNLDLHGAAWPDALF